MDEMYIFFFELMLDVIPLLIFLFGIPVVAKKIFQQYYGVRTAAALFEKKLEFPTDKIDFSNFTTDSKHFS